jgi:2-hydroxy-3-keto-5-methylthiopentenyl-1-phosphate phosphatase
VRLVLDWDGTVTDRDTLVAVVLRFGDKAVFDRLDGEIGRTRTQHQVIAREVETLDATLDEMTGYLLETVRVRAGFRELAERYQPTIVSAGFHELIGPLLVREGIELDVHANRLESTGAGGWRAVFADTRSCPVCGEACKRAAMLAGGAPVTFVGDGVSDCCAALGADRVFARDWLAQWLDERAAPYELWHDFHELARTIAR